MRGLLLTSQFTYLAFAVSGVRNLWLAAVLLPENLAANSLSSLIIALGLFMDFGAVYSIKRVVPKDISDGKDPSSTLTSIKSAMASTLCMFGLLLAVIGILLVIFGQQSLAIGVFAGSVILPVQGLSNFRNAAYVALGKPTRGSSLILGSVTINFLMTLILEPLIHEYVIIATPVIGYVVALSIDNKFAGNLAVGRIKFPVELRVLSTLAKSNFSLSQNQILAFALVTVESWLAFGLLSLKDAATLGLIANMTAAISVLPVTFSNQIQTHMALKKNKSNLGQIHALIRASRIFLLESLAFVALGGALCMSLLIQNLLPAYSGGLISIWLMALSTFIYGSTFYTSTYPILREVERKISKAQLISISVFLLCSMVLATSGNFNLKLLCFLSAVKSIVYVHSVSRIMYRVSKKALVHPLVQVGSTLLRALPIFICIAGVSAQIIYIVVLGVAIEVTLLATRILPAWKSLAIHLSKARS